MTQQTSPKSPNGATENKEPQPPRYACSHCTDCGYNNFPPADVCPRCWSANTNLQGLSPEGVLYSFSTIGSAPSVEFVGYVDLPENVRVFGLLNTPAKERPTCGAPVNLSSVRAPGVGPCYVFDLTKTAGGLQ